MRIQDCDDDYRVMVNYYPEVYLALLKHRDNNDYEAVEILEKAISKNPCTRYGTGPILSIKEIKRVFLDYWYNPPFCIRL